MRAKVLRGLACGMAVGALMVAVQALGWLHAFELRTLDWRIRSGAHEGAGDDRLVLIQVDERSLDYLREIEQPWPPRRTIWESAIRFCFEGQARVMVLDQTFDLPSAYSIAMKEMGITEGSDDDAFALAVKEAGKVFVAATLWDPGRALKQADGEGSAKPPLIIHAADAIPSAFTAPGLSLPIEPLRSSVAGVGSAFVQGDPDGVRRGYPPAVLAGGVPYPSLATLVAAELLGARELHLSSHELRIGDRRVPLDGAGRIQLRFHGPSGQPDNRMGRPYFTVPFWMVYESAVNSATNRIRAEAGATSPPLPVRIQKEYFRDKVVFLGYSADDLGDLHSMPLGETRPGVLLHMTALDNILHEDPLRRAPAWAQRLGLFLSCVLAALAMSVLSGWRGPATGLALLAAGCVGPWLAFDAPRLWIDVIPLEAGILFALTVSSVANYLFEYRQKREIRRMFSVYLAPNVVDQLVTQPERLRLGGETREMTMFFSDLAGFTTISEGMPPERLVTVMNEYLGRVTEVIQSTGGTVDKYIGDAVVAFWNAPLDQPDHALRACQAALDGQRALEELRRRYPMLSMRVGLNTGIVTVGNMGCKEKFNYTVMGDAVNLASRLEGANKNYHTATMIGEETQRHVEGKMVTRELDRLRVKGKERPVRVHELLGRPGEVPEKTMLSVGRYEKGLAAYRERRWSDAVQCFQSALDLVPEDGPAQLYLARCHEYMVQPPESDWDGVTVLTTK